MTKLDKQISETLLGYNFDGKPIQNLNKNVSKIKQSILKAIVEEFRKGECMFCNHNGDCDKSILKFESVIKEILGDSKDNKI